MVEVTPVGCGPKVMLSLVPTQWSNLSSSMVMETVSKNTLLFPLLPVWHTTRHYHWLHSHCCPRGCSLFWMKLSMVARTSCAVMARPGVQRRLTSVFGIARRFGTSIADGGPSLAPGIHNVPLFASIAQCTSALQNHRLLCLCATHMLWLWGGTPG
jgi:hypothetical protein